MSRYGEPGVPYGAYPGQPGEPYDPPSDPWGQGDGDLTAPQPPGAHPGYQPPPYDQPYQPPYGPYEQPPGRGYEQPYDGPYEQPYDGPYDQPPPGPPPGGPGGPPPAWDPIPDLGHDLPPAGLEPPEQRGNALLYVAVGLLVLVVAAAVAYALYLLSGEEGAPTVAGTVSPGPAASAPPATEPGPESTQDNVGLNAATAREGDCLTNLGTEAEPQLQVVACDADQSGPVYLVLAKFDTEVEGDDSSAQNASAQATCDSTDGYTHHYFEVSEALSFVLCMEQQ